MRDALGNDNPAIQKALAGKTPEQAARVLIAETKLDDAQFREQLYQGGESAIQASTDPMITLMRAIDPDARAARRRFEDEVDSVEKSEGSKIARAVFSEYGFGKTTTYTYDTLNRLLTKVPDASLSEPTVTFTYTPTGKRATMADASGSTTYTYDNRDRMVTEATPEGTLNYTYDAHGNVLTLASSNTNGASQSYTYDALNRLASVVDNRLLAQGAASGTTSYTYDAAGNLLNYTDPNSVQTTDTYDALNRLTNLVSAKTGTNLASYAYTVGAAGNRTNVLELNSRNVAYAYDNIYRLTSEAVTADPGGENGTVNYTSYDNVGNRLAMTSTLNAVPGGTFTYDQNDRLTTDTYDNDGNTVSSGIADTYDFENHMLTHGAVTMVYDGDGNRVSETVGGTGGVTTQYLIDDRNPTGLTQVMDEVVNGAVTKTYAYGLQRISENQQIGGTWTPSFYGYDGHGNVRFLTNAAGAITDTYTYDAFGLLTATTGSTPNAYTYSGERFDQNIGLFHLRARDYNPLTGRFETMDPAAGDILNPATLHKYVYAGNNPVNAIDPTGRGFIENWSIRIWIFTQITIPLYLQTPQGKAAVLLGGTILNLALTEKCELLELGEQLRDLLETGTVVKGPGLFCNSQPDFPEHHE